MRYLLLLMTFLTPPARCNTITLDKPATAAVLGQQFTLTCHVGDATVTGLVSFMILVKGNYGSVCRVQVDIGLQATGNASYLCQSVVGQQHTYSLTIRNVSVEHDTSWMCQNAGKSSNTVHLDVHYPPTLDIRPVEPCLGYTLFLNEKSVFLNCSVKAANPSPNNYTWYHGGKLAGTVQIYTIPIVYRSSSGQYRCVADNGVQPPGEDSVKVDVHYSPVVKIAGKQRVVNESEDLTIHCSAEANPDVTSVVWTKQSVGGRISDNGTLLLKNIRKTDAGVYVCTATNTVTRCRGRPQNKSSTSDIRLDVQHAPEILSFRVTSGDRTVTEHDNVTLLCHISSYPASTIEIRNRTSSIGTGTSIKTLGASIEDVGCLHTGTYTCSAKNVFGQAVEQNKSLQVKCAPKLYGSTPVFRSSLNRTVTLNLTVIAFPKPTFTWRKIQNGRPLNCTKGATEGVRVTGSVTISDVKENDFRNYTVEVSNSEGSVNLNVMLISASSPETPKRLQASTNSPRSLTVTWEKAFNGGATQRFEIQYREPGGQWTTHPSRPGEGDALHLDIDDLEPGTVYQIRMSACNEHGVSDYTDVIRVATESDVTANYSLIAGIAGAVVLIAFGIFITIVLLWRNRKRAQPGTPGDKRQVHGIEEIVMEDNVLYETSGDLQRSLVVDHSDLYTDINKVKTANNAIDEMYAKPQKEKRTDKIEENNRGDIYAQPQKDAKKKKTTEKQEDPAADIYAMPQKEKKKGKPKGHLMEKNGGSINMKSSGEYSVLGSEFTFTCEVVNASVTGLFTFMRRDNSSFQPVCRVTVSTGQQITENNTFLCSDEGGQRHTYTLTIRNVSREDSTDWQCQGGGMSSNTVTVDVRYPPKVAIQAMKLCSGFTFLVAESNVVLTCTVKEANPAPTNFTWYHGDVVLKSGADQIYSIDLVTRSSQGQYRCTADNGISPPGQAHETVTVHYPPILHLDTTKRVVKESDDLTIHCTAQANPEVTSIVWTKNGVGATIASNGTLHLKNIKRSDAGVYICKATNRVTACRGKEQNKSSSLTVTVEVQYPPTVAIHVVKPCSGFTFLVNESNVDLNCTVEGANPAPTNFTWYHGDVVLKRGADQIYTIDRVTNSSQGQYRCTADNGISPPGQAHETATVHYPPIVNINGTKRLVNESDDLTINCTAEAHPEVTSIVWTRGGEGGIISHNGTLRLKNIQKIGAGKYVCTATNDVTTCHGTEQKKNSSTVTVEVQYAPRIEYFGVTSGDRTVTVTEHDNVTLQCNISSYPASTIEIWNNTSSIERRKFSNYNSVQTMKAMLLDVSCQEGGTYTCSAENLIGKAPPQTVLLNVTCAPRRYSSSSDNLVFASNLHENATLSLTVIAFPQPTFEWRKKPNSRPISTTRVSTEGVHVTGSVTILDVKEEDFLNYTVNVENTEGKLEVKIALVSKSRPYKPSNLKAANIYPRSVTLKWEKAFNGGATQRFNIQYRQHGGQWTTHPSSPSEDDALHLDIDDLEPGTLYEIRMNALNDYGNSSYVSITVTTATDPDNSSTTVGVVAAVVGVIGVIVIIAVIIVKRRKNKHKGQDASMADQREWDDARVVANNDLYETSADLDIHPSGPGAGVDANDVYAVVNKPAKTNNPHEDIYAQPKKKKGQTKEKRKADIVSPALGAARGGEGSGAEVKEGQKTGIDEDGLLYVSVDFSGRPQASNVIIRSEEETEYSGIDFVASAVKKE
ncbi:hemicentin-1-like isoform X2 [Haliotis cracherodii]|uniref:hemicentin-1-like isoform X2 n=1 Tax=Haliotis cracherodii TaxID=6455 RepID=UPI0039EA339B